MKVTLEIVTTQQEYNIRKKGTTCYGINFETDTCEAYRKEYCLLFGKRVSQYRCQGSFMLMKKLPECIEFCKSNKNKIIREVSSADIKEVL